VILDQSGKGLDRPLSYLPPRGGTDRLELGSYVLAPLRERRQPGFVVGFSSERPPFALKRLFGLLADEPLLTVPQIATARWLAERYASPLADALRCFLPPGATRRVRRLARLLRDDGLPELLATVGSRAERQQQVVRLLHEAGGELPLGELEEALPGADVAAALHSLEQKGLARLVRELAPPQAAPKTRQFARLAEAGLDWPAEIAARSAAAPRQAEVLGILYAEQAPVPLSALPSRAAVQSLAAARLVVVGDAAVRRRPLDSGLGAHETEFRTPTPAQAAALEAIGAAVDRGGGMCLLHGVTGSGKTEVYLHAIRHTLARGRQAIVLVPEISLTPQLVGRFRARFGERLAVLHSAMGGGERFDEWWRAARGEAQIVIGARSAIFAPLPRLGLVVIDEEHERAYKQSSPPRYDAREVARRRCRDEGAALLLGSATPSVEAYYEFAAPAGRPTERRLAAPGHVGQPVPPGDRAPAPQPERFLLELPERIDGAQLPVVELVDMRREPQDEQGHIFSTPLETALAECLSREEQAILFLNRRGFSTFVLCRECGFAVGCPNCSVALTFHHRWRAMVCHHCTHREAVPDLCPRCAGRDIGFRGLGTERVQDQVQRRFPQARVGRMDRDTTRQKDAHGRILREFAEQRVNVLVGTQMIAKGLDFPCVTLVGVLNADTALHRPDFRAPEHTFQLLTQVAGRAGRAARAGRVIVQTYNPEHYAVRCAQQHDYHTFFREELQRRQAVRGAPYPPFTRMAALLVADRDEPAASALARRLGERLRELAAADPDITIGGPAPAPLVRLKGKYRWYIMPRGPSGDVVRHLVQEAVRGLEAPDAARVTLDIDPVEIM